MAKKRINIELMEAEALVFFEWLTRNDNAEALRCDDPAEQTVLWKMEAALERTLVQPLAPNYRALLAEAGRLTSGTDPSGHRQPAPCRQRASTLDSTAPMGWLEGGVGIHPRVK